MTSMLRLSHSEHFAVCTLTTVKALGDEEHAVRGLVPGVLGTEVMRRCLGVEGRGVLRWTSLAVLVLVLALGVLGVIESLGPGVRVGVSAGAGVGVVERAIVRVVLRVPVMVR